MKLFTSVYLALIMSCSSVARKPASLFDDHGYLPIVASVVCEIECQGSSLTELKERNRTFDPSFKSLAPSNSRGPRAITMRMQLFADDVCKESALSHCQSAERILFVNAKSISSGNWQAPLPLRCSSTDPAVISPYDESMKPVTTTRTQFFPTYDDFNPASDFDVGQVPHQGVTTAPPKDDNCEHPILGQACFGDCTTLIKDSWYMTLSGPSYAGKQTIPVCGDKLYESPSFGKQSQSLRTLACRKYFYNELMKNPNDGLMSCTALRANLPDCDHF